MGLESRNFPVLKFSIFDFTRKPSELPSPRSERSQGRSLASRPAIHASVEQVSRSLWPGRPEV